MFGNGLHREIGEVVQPNGHPLVRRQTAERAAQVQTRVRVALVTGDRAHDCVAHGPLEVAFPPTPRHASGDETDPRPGCVERRQVTPPSERDDERLLGNVLRREPHDGLDASDGPRQFVTIERREVGWCGPGG